jgi:DNA polymerase III subunit beta
MEFTVSKSDLVRELSLSQGVVEKKTTIPILSNVLLEAAGDHVTLTATDLELGIRCSCPARVKKEGAGTLPARKLLDYVRLLPEGDVQMKFLENHWASITSGRSRTRIAGMSRESFPELPQMPEPIAALPMKMLASMISRTSFAISMEESRFTLNGALLVMRPDALTMVATDGHRLAYVQAGGPPAGSSSNGPSAVPSGVAEIGQISQAFRALMPKKAMLEIVKLAELAEDGACGEFAGDDNHLFFQVGPRLLITRKLTGNFPDYERVLPKDHIHVAKLQKDEIKSAIERVSQFADERSRAIRVQFSNGEVKVFSSSVESGDSEESVTSEYQGPDLEIGFNAQYLLDFLRAIPQDRVAFELKDQKSAGEMRPFGESIPDQYRYVVMPMRI